MVHTELFGAELPGTKGTLVINVGDFAQIHGAPWCKWGHLVKNLAPLVPHWISPCDSVEPLQLLPGNVCEYGIVQYN